ncbi:hypothetical protein P3L10_005545 [Capsicum annuum]
MAYRSERVKGLKIRVFTWIQHMIKNHVLDHHYQLGSSSRFGFLVLRVKNKIRVVKPRYCDSKNRGGQIKMTTFKKSVQPFKICETPEECVEGIDFALGLSHLFFEDTTPYLADTIYDYLSSSFGENLNFLSNIDAEFNKIVVVIDVDMQSERFAIESQGSNEVCKFVSTDLYETLMNDEDDNEDKECEFYLQVDGVQQSCAGVRKKRRTDVQKIPVFEVEYIFDDPDIQEILDTLLDFLTKKGGFHNKLEVFNGEIQRFKKVKSGLKIVKLEKENVVSFAWGDICPVCFEIFEERSVAVVTPCSHIFHRSCIFTWLSENNTCPMCRKSCNA